MKNEQDTNNQSDLMKRLCDWINNHQLHSAAAFLALVIACVITAFHAPIISTALTVISYFFLGLIIFSVSEPLPSEASLIFLLFLLAAVIYIFIFGRIYITADAIKCTTDACQIVSDDYFYYSAVVFTSLGFGDFSPQNHSGKLITSIQALLGMAYSATLLVMVMGRSHWLPEDKEKKESVQEHELYRPTLTELKQRIAEIDHQLNQLSAPLPLLPNTSRKLFSHQIKKAALLFFILLAITSSQLL